MVEVCCGWGRCGPMTLGPLLSLMFFVLWSGHMFPVSLFFVRNTTIITAMRSMVIGAWGIENPGCARHRVRSFVRVIGCGHRGSLLR